MNNKGIITLELFLAIVVLAILTTGSMAMLFPALKSTELGRQKLQAKWLLWEEEEAIRQVRNEAWANLIDGTYYAQYNTTSNPPTTYQGWQLYPGIGTKNGFNEYLVITTPFKINENQVADSGSGGGTQDPNIRKIQFYVYWTSFGTTYTEGLTTYLTDWRPF